MYVLALATDYDETIADEGIVSEATQAALARLKETGRKLILVTGRELADLERVFPGLEIFDKIVAENGAILYTPASKEQRDLAPSPSADFVARLQARGVTPLSVGRTVVATLEPHQTVALELIKELGLELEIIFNKGAVMILPSGINKATGLAAALDEMGLVRPQCRRHRRRRERPRLPARRRLWRRRRQRAAEAQGDRRPHHERHPRRRRGRAGRQDHLARCRIAGH